METTKKVAQLPSSGTESVPGAFALKNSVLFSRGKHTLAVPMSLHFENRSKLVQKMAKDTTGGNSWLVFRGGVARERDDSDHEEVFRQESFFQYLFGVKESGWFGALECTTGRAVLFAPKLPKEYAVWMGFIESKENLSERYGVEVHWIEDMEEILGKNKFCMQGINSDSGTDINDVLPVMDCTLSPRLYNAISECRVLKSESEIEVVRYACSAASLAHVAVMRSAKAGDYEYQLEARFLGSIYEFHGCRHAAYTSICACGPNAAVLHYGHAGAPNDRQLRESDMALLDMGAEYHCYCSDITCSFPVSGTFSSDQRIIYEAVLGAQLRVFSEAKVGASWVSLHELAEQTILTHLKEANLLLGDVDDMLANDLGAVFMPHGLGHLIGLDTHDVGGYLPDSPPRPTRPGKSKLRTARLLEPGMLITVEPGCYFIDALIDPALDNEKTAKYFNRQVLQRFRRFGGVRIEDVVLMTEDQGLCNLTLCPRTVHEIESTMKGGTWPPQIDAAPDLRRQWGTYQDGHFVITR